MMPFLTWSLGVGVDPVEISQTSLPFVDFFASPFGAIAET